MCKCDYFRWHSQLFISSLSQGGSALLPAGLDRDEMAVRGREEKKKEARKQETHKTPAQYRGGQAIKCRVK